MILFVGTEQRGYFLRETADMRKMKLAYTGSSPSVSLQVKRYTGTADALSCDRCGTVY